MENLILGFSTATSLSNLIWCFLGATLGTLVGVLPGLGPTATISLLLPLIYKTGDPVGSIIFLAGIYYGSQYGGSITSILLKLPGEVSSTITVVDGYAMTQQGRSGAALTITALASFVGGTLATIAIALLAHPLSEIAFLFGPVEYASLMLLGILASVAVTQGSTAKGMISVCLGGFLGLVGTNISTGEIRFTAGIVYLNDGISFAVMAIGLFGLGEILYNVMNKTAGLDKPASVSSLYPTSDEIKKSIFPTFRGTVLGTILGLLPGGGATLSSFLSYAVERKVSRDPKSFGQGNVAGVAAPEAANNASSQSQFLPTLMLGLPITPIMALIISVLVMAGIQPGPAVINKNPELFWGLIASMWIGNLMLIFLNIPLVRIWVAILHIPKWLMYPAIILISVAGAYSINNSWFDVGLLIIFGMLGVFLRFLDFELAPMVLAFVIAPMFEEYFQRAMTIGDGNFRIFVDSPISVSFIVIALSLIIFSTIKKYVSNRG